MLLVRVLRVLLLVRMLLILSVLLMWLVRQRRTRRRRRRHHLPVVRVMRMRVLLVRQRCAAAPVGRWHAMVDRL